MIKKIWKTRALPFLFFALITSLLLLLIEGIVCLRCVVLPQGFFYRQNNYSRGLPCPRFTTKLLMASSPDRLHYTLGLGKNKPLVDGRQGTGSKTENISDGKDQEVINEKSVWIGPIASMVINRTLNTGNATMYTPYTYNAMTDAAEKMQRFAASIIKATKTPRKTQRKRIYKLGLGKNRPLTVQNPMKKKTLVAFDEQSNFLSRAVWNEDYFDPTTAAESSKNNYLFSSASFLRESQGMMEVPKTIHEYRYEPENSIDTVWLVMRHEAKREAQLEPLLVSFLYSSIINHDTLESALAFHLANLLSSPAMISTQVMSLIEEALDSSDDFRISLRKDILAVRDRDPACTCLPDVFLYFKGFHALQTYRVAHYLWKSGRQMLAHHLQSQMSQVFQVDIHPSATLGNGIMLDHGTGIVIGETAVVGHNCSILHHVTLGGSGKTGADRHPKIGNGVLLGAGASVLGNIRVGDGCQIGAGTLVIQDLPPHCVAVGVPSKIIGSFIDVMMQPSLSMNQTLIDSSEEMIVFDTEGSNI